MTWGKMSDWFRRKTRRTDMRYQITATLNAFKRGEAELWRMTREWEKAGAVCCQGCMFPGPQGFVELQRKQERRQAWLKVLNAKLERDSGNG